MNRYKIKNQAKGRNNQNDYSDEDRLSVDNSQSRLASTGQAFNRMWRNLNTSVLFEDCANVFIQNKGCFANKPLSSQDMTTLMFKVILENEILHYSYY